MRYSLSLAAAALCTTEVFAFPSRMFGRHENEEQRRAISSLGVLEHSLLERAPGFDAAEQYVSTSGQYAFVAPGPGDLRGPCPGLNAMANHGYIPHNGIATIPQFIDGTLQVFGMGRDLGGFLAIYGALIDGDLSKWSIGGPPPAGGLLSGLGLLAQPSGLIGSHNKYEGDASPTRPDLYQFGDNYKVIISQFEEMFAQPKGPNGYDLTSLTPFRANRFQQSIENNPYFFNGPFSGVLVQPAAYTFIYRFMGNKSAEFPEGYLDEYTLKSFFSITGEPGNFKWTEGYERIPENWYKRAIGDEYTIPFFLGDVLAAAAEYPQFLNIGGNTGKVDTFTGVDLEDLTGGVFNLATLLEGNNLGCFVAQFLQQATPDILKGLFKSLDGALNLLSQATGGLTAGLTCPQLVAIDESQLDQFPGAKGTTSK